jgi:hypothetical protein
MSRSRAAVTVTSLNSSDALVVAGVAVVTAAGAADVSAGLAAAGSALQSSHAPVHKSGFQTLDESMMLPRDRIA